MQGFFLVLSAYGRGGYPKEKYSCTRNPIRPARLGENSTRTREKTYEIRPNWGGADWVGRIGWVLPTPKKFFKLSDVSQPVSINITKD